MWANYEISEKTETIYTYNEHQKEKFESSKARHEERGSRKLDTQRVN